MLAGFAAAFLVGDMFLAVRCAPPHSAGFLYGVAGFSLAQLLWTAGQLREARPDMRVFAAVAVPLVLFSSVRLGPPVLARSAMASIVIYSLISAVSFATALATRRIFYALGIGLLLFSDMMIGMRLLGLPGCGVAIGPVYLAAEACLVVSFMSRNERRLEVGGFNARRSSIVCGALALAFFAAAMACYPGGGYNPFCQMLSALGRTKVRDVAFPACHYWFMGGMAFSSAAVACVWISLVHRCGAGWRRVAFGWGGAVNVAGLVALTLVPENVNMMVHNAGCHLAVAGGAAILAARFRKGGDMAWTLWLASVIAVFGVCLLVRAIPFSPWVTTMQKLLIVSFAIWSLWLAGPSGTNRSA